MMLSLNNFRKKLKTPGRLLESYRYRRNRYYKYFKSRIHLISGPKIFCIGMNKTGTSSMGSVMTDLGFVVGIQSEAEKLIHHWAKRDFKPIIRYCRRGTFFQDIPFSLPYTFIAMDKAFKNSKFILTVRDDSEQWYNSVLEFDRVEREYRNRRAGYAKAIIWNTTDEDILNKEILIKTYEDHNQTVKDYFRYRKKDLLILNVAEKDAYQKLCNFLGIDEKREQFPWINRTSDFEKSIIREKK